MKRALLRIAVPMGVYLLLEWLFSYATQTEGLFSPRGMPNVEVVAVGAAYLAARLFVHLAVPMMISLTLGTLPRRSAR
jgi:hypothetical protein